MGEIGKSGLISSPFGMVVVGADDHGIGEDYTFDCWKPILHDESTEPSKGMFLRDVASDPRIKKVIENPRGGQELPELVFENIWDERFLIEFVILSNGQLCAHAIRI